MLTGAELAEELGELTRKMRPSVARGAMKAAERMLRDCTDKPLEECEVQLLLAGMARGQEYALYLDDRSYPKVQAVILDAVYADKVRVMYSNGIREEMALADYNTRWRLWSKYPSGVERKMHEWRARK